MDLLPATQKALIATIDGKWKFDSESPVPYLKDGEVLVRVEAVALNPSDAKQLDNCPIDGAICGSNLAGTVMRIRKGMKKDLNVGDRVSTLILGCNPRRPDNGAFAQYAAARAEFCINLPDTFSFLDGATMSVGLVTCGLALKSLGLVDEMAEINVTVDKSSAYVLVYGVSTATGTLAIQLLRYLGYSPIAVCSPHSFVLAKKAGAACCLDYKKPGCSDEIRSISDGRLEWALDCIGTPTSTTCCYSAIGSMGGRYTALNPVPNRLRLRKKKVRPDWILGYTIFGSDVKLSEEYAKEASCEDAAFTAAWIARMEALLWHGQLRAHQTVPQPDGLRGIARDRELLKASRARSWCTFCKTCRQLKGNEIAVQLLQVVGSDAVRSTAMKT